VIAGIVELPGIVFAGWALLGTLLWTPALVLLTAIIGDAFIGPISSLIGSAWKADIVAAVVIVLLLRSMRATRSQVPVLADVLAGNASTIPVTDLFERQLRVSEAPAPVVYSGGVCGLDGAMTR